VCFFAIYGFIWFFVDLGFKMLSSGNARGTIETYFLKAIQYVFLVNVIFLFSIDMNSGRVSLVHLYPIIVILILYFIGKFQKGQNNMMMFSRTGLNMSNIQFNPRYEAVVIIIALVAFVGLMFRPDFANNAVALWFKESILDIESTAIIGFVFKIIGFFFLIGILLKTVNAFQYISRMLFDRKSKGDSDFDDYEEVS
jgi:hypothetical protein